MPTRSRARGSRDDAAASQGEAAARGEAGGDYARAVMPADAGPALFSRGRSGERRA